MKSWKQYHNMAKKKKEDFKNVENLLMAYGIILPALRITLRHNKELVWQKVSLQDSAVVMHSIHGKAVMGQMEWKRGEFQDPEMKIELCVPKPGSDVATMSRSTPDKSVHCVNGRPVIVKEIDKLVRQYYSNCHACDMSRHPVYFVRIELPAGDVDVNLEPNKTTVMTTNMTSLRERIEEMLLYLYGPLDQAPSWRYRDADDGGSSSKPEDQQPSNSELIQFQKNHDKLEVKSNSSANACSMSVPMEKGSASNSVTAPLDNGPHSVAHENAQRRLSESKQTSENMSNGCPLSETSGAENVSALTKTPHADFVCDEPQQRMKTDELSISGNFDLGAEILDELLGSFPSTDSNSEKTVSSSNLAEKMELESTETNIDGNSGSVGQSSKEGTGLQSGPGVTSGESAGSSKGQGDGKNRSCVPEPPQAGPSGWNHGTSIMSGAGTPIQPVQLLAPSPSHFPGKRPLSPSHDQQVQRQTAPAEKRQNISSRRLCPAQSTLYDMINNVAVKRAMSAKEIFFKEKRPKVLEENPQADYEEVTEILAEAWNSLSDQEQAVFREKCWQDTQRYNKEAATAKNVAGKVKASAKTRPCLGLTE
nr:hypothetical protein BaRGS_018542 [Batillaria attramentaria]